MTSRLLFRLTIVLIGFLSACSSSSNSVTGKGSVRGIHAIPELGTVNFMIEETVLSSLNYKEASGTAEYDDLNYDFGFEILLPGDTDATTLATENVSVNVETEYTFVLAGTFADPELILWQQFGRDWAQELADADDAGTEVTVLETSFGHLDIDLGPVDVFLESPGTSPRFATPLGTIQYGELLPAVEFPAGDYQLIFTPAGDPATILFASDSVALTEATSNLFTIMDSAGLTTGDFSVRWIGTSLGVELVDLFVQPEISILHAAYGTDPVDVMLSDDFANPVVAGLAYSQLSGSVQIDDGTVNLIVTPAGNPGVFLAQKEISIEPGTYNRLVLAGLPGSMQTVRMSHDYLRLATHARVQLFQGAARFQTMDIYLVADDVDIALTSPTYSSTLFGSGTGYTSREAQSYNFVLTESGTKNIIGGPFHLDLELGRNYGIVIVDAADITAADILLIDQTPD